MKLIKYSNGEIPPPPFSPFELSEWSYAHYHSLSKNLLEETFPCGCILQTHMLGMYPLHWPRLYRCVAHGRRTLSDLNVHEFAWVRAAWKHPDLALLLKLRCFMRT